MTDFDKHDQLKLAEIFCLSMIFLFQGLPILGAILVNFLPTGEVIVLCVIAYFVLLIGLLIFRNNKQEE